MINILMTLSVMATLLIGEANAAQRSFAKLDDKTITEEPHERVRTDRINPAPFKKCKYKALVLFSLTEDVFYGCSGLDDRFVLHR